MADVTVAGTRGDVLAYLAEHLQTLDEIAERTSTPAPASERLPLERLQHLESLVKCVRTSLSAGGTPSPHYLRAVAGQAVLWLEELRERGEVSW